MVQDWNVRLQSGEQGMCSMAREAQSAFYEVLAFYEACPINDPHGEMRQYARDMIAWGQETEAASCS